MLSVENQGVYDVAGVPALSFERSVFLEHLAHVSQADFLVWGKL